MPRSRYNTREARPDISQNGLQAKTLIDWTVIRQRKDRYNSFQELTQYAREGVDFRITITDRESGTTIIAPHGGKIESKTSEIARAIAGRDFNLYCFEGIRKSRNYEILHIPSHRFDEPKCIQLLSHSHSVLAIHGCADSGTEIFVGGRNGTLRRMLTLKLQESGFVAHDENHPYPGEDKKNICNRGSTGEGVQIELTKSFRESSATNGFIRIVRGVILAQQST